MKINMQKIINYIVSQICGDMNCVGMNYEESYRTEQYLVFKINFIHLVNLILNTSFLLKK